MSFKFDTLNRFQNLYFITSTWVKKLNQYFYCYQSLKIKMSELLLEERSVDFCRLC